MYACFTVHIHVADLYCSVFILFCWWCCFLGMDFFNVFSCDSGFCGTPWCRFMGCIFMGTLLGAQWRQEALGLPRARELVAPLKQGAQRFAEVVEAHVWCDETEKELAISSFVETVLICVHIHIHIHIFIFIFISLYSAINIPLHFFSYTQFLPPPKVGGFFRSRPLRFRLAGETWHPDAQDLKGGLAGELPGH